MSDERWSGCRLDRTDPEIPSDLVETSKLILLPNTKEDTNSELLYRTTPTGATEDSTLCHRDVPPTRENP